MQSSIHVSRVVKVSVHDPTEIWKELSGYAFSEYSFVLTSEFPKHSFPEGPQHFSLEFINFKIETSQYVDVGSDPFLRPFVYIYALRVKNSKELINHKEDLINWSEKVSMFKPIWHIFIFQEANFFENISVQQIFSGSSEDFIQSITIINKRRKSQLNDNSIETLRVRLSRLLEKSFIQYYTETKNKILKDPKPSKTRSWYPLLLYFFGFTETALSEYSNQLKRLLKINYNIFKEKLNPLQVSSLTQYPYSSCETFNSTIIFIVSGIMSIHYSQTQFNEMLNDFFSFWSYLQSRADTPEKVQIVETWAQDSIQQFLLIPNLDEQHQILNLLQFIKTHDTNIGKALLQSLPYDSSFTRIAILSFIENNPMENINAIENWHFGATIIKNYIDTLKQQNKWDEIASTLPHILSSRQYPTIKSSYLELLYSLQRKIVITNPFPLDIKVNSPIFYSSVSAGLRSSISLKFRLPLWFTIKFDSVRLVFKYSKQSKKEQQDQKIKERISFDFKDNLVPNADISDEHFIDYELPKFNMYRFKGFISFMEPGDWHSSYLVIKKENLILRWKYKKNCKLNPFIPPLVETKFPYISGINVPLNVSIHMDFTSRLLVSNSVGIKFEDAYAVIPDQTGNATYFLADGQKEVGYEFKENKLIFSEPPVNVKVDLHLIFSITKDISSSQMNVIVTIGNKQFMTSHLCNFRYPLKCYLRLQSNSFVNLVIHNSAPIPINISSADFAENHWNLQTILPNSDLFFLGQIPEGEDAHDYTMKIEANEQNGHSLKHEFQIEKPTNSANIKVRCSKYGQIGKPIEVECELPAGPYQINGNDNFIILGNTKRNQFNGGILKFSFIPLKGGIVQTPTIRYQDIDHQVIPRFIDISLSSLDFLTPLL